MPFWDSNTGPFLYAHRGANREFPENTIEAFRRAVELGADVLELDIHPTKDGVFVVSHDDSGARNAGNPARIGDRDWSEVRAWDAGWGFEDEPGSHPFRGKDCRIPRFDAVLEMFHDMPLNVDVKHATAPQLQGLLDVIRNAHATER
ncbi:MAG TPA: glycerophosphodiester phosphodiesterase family protein, partial [Polyangiaceae bacterium]